MTNKTNPMGNLPWKRTLLSTAVALATTQSVAVAADISEPTLCGTTISSTVAGCQISTADHVTITDTGLVTSGSSSVDSAAIHMIGDGLGADLTNNGSIDASSWAGIYAEGDYSGDIVNNGEISSSGPYLYANGIYVEGSLYGSISNRSTGLINAAAYDGSANAWGIDIDYNTEGDINNTGEINAYAWSDSSSAIAWGVNVDGTVNGSITNDGTIAAEASMTPMDGYGSMNIYGSASASASTSVTDGYATDYERDTSYSVYAADATAIEADYLFGNITNNGDIVANAYGSANISASAWANATAYAYASASSATAYATAYANAYAGAEINATGIRINDTLAGNITNNGDITVAASGSASLYSYESSYSSSSSYENGYGSAYASAYANANAHAYLSVSAIGINAYDVTGNISNTGNIAAEADASGWSNYSAYGTNYVEASAIGINVYEINSYGSISNSGDISADAWASIGGSGYGNNGAAAYAGGITADYSGGSIDNSGTINASAAIQASSEYSYGSAGAAGIAVNYLYGEVNNSGIINASAEAFDHASSAWAVGVSANYLSSYGSLENSGTINASASIDENLWGDADVELYAAGISASGSDGEIGNSGTINASATANINVSSSWFSVSAFALASAAGITSQYGSATISNTGSIHVEAHSNVTADSYYYYGSMARAASVATGIDSSSLYSDGSMTNSNDITVSADADSYSDGFFPMMTRPAGRPDVNSYGSMPAFAVATGMNGNYVYGSINNKGSIQSTADASGLAAGAIAYGINADYLMGYGSISNSASIDASANADGFFAIANATGINADFVYDYASVSNTGNITATAAADGMYESYAHAAGIRSNVVNGYGSLSNEGDISVSVNPENFASASAVGIEVSNYVGGSVSNTGNIDVVANNNDGAWGSATGIYIGNIDGSLSNTGSITAKAINNDGAGGRAYGIDIGYIYSNATVSNSGSISASSTGTGASDAFAQGFDFDYADGSIINDGGISASALSELAATAGGVSGYQMSYGSLVTNNGLISATANGGSYAWASGIDLDYVYSGASLVNNGSIEAVASAGSFAEATGVGINEQLDGNLINNSNIGAHASAVYAEATGLYVGIMNNSISNYGSISATAIASADGRHVAKAVDLDYDYSSSDFNNYGSISAYAEGGLDSTSNEIYAIYTDGYNNITNHGLVSGAIHTDGNYTSGEGSTHEFVIQSEQASANYNSWIGGYGSLAGAELKVKATADSVLEDDDTFYNIINSNNNLIIDQDQLGTLKDNLLLYSFDLVWDADADEPTSVDEADNNVDLVVSRKAITSAADGMYSEIAKVLETMYQNDSGCSSPACDQLNDLIGQVNNAGNEEELQALLASAMPAFGGQTAFAVARSSRAINDAILNRQDNGRGKSSGDLMSDKKVWAKIITSDATRDETDEAVGYDVENGGILIGVDGDLSKGTRLGFAVAMTRGEIDGLGVISSQNVELDNTQILVYADWSIGDNDFANFQAGYGQGDNTLETTAGEVDYDTSMFSLRGGYGSNVKLSDNWTMTPEVSLTYIAVSEDAYTLGLLEVDERDSDTLEAGVNGKFAYAINDRIDFTTRLGLAYDLLGDETEVDSSFISGPAFSTEAEQDAVSGIIGLGLDVAHSEHTSFSLNYDYMDRGEFDANTISAKVNHSF